MKTQSTFNAFPYGLPTGSVHPYNSLADTIKVDDTQTLLWQRGSSIFERLTAQIKKFDTLIHRERYAQMDSGAIKRLSDDLAETGLLE